MGRFIIAAALALTSVATLAQAAPIKGEIVKIDAAQGKLTLKHGPIPNLDMNMESMTMVFAVADPAMLKPLKVGEKVSFEADRVNGRITVTKIDKSK